VPEVRVLVVSPSPLARAGMQSLLAGMEGIATVASCGVAEAAALAAQLVADVMLLDVGAGDPADLEAVAQLAEAEPSLPVVALGGRAGASVQALSLGAAAVLPSEVDRPTLAAALHACAQRLVVLEREDLVSLLRTEEPAPARAAGLQETLTPRELEVLQAMARGLTNRQIALRLEISEHTVKFHAAAVLGKLDARSRAEAVARGIGLGWIMV
jgi:DNA-binding NarL/FixJ family response regulator